MILENNKIIFISIAKSGSSEICATLTNTEKTSYFKSGHLPIQLNLVSKEEASKYDFNKSLKIGHNHNLYNWYNTKCQIKDYFIFSWVRNPYDRLVSVFYNCLFKETKNLDPNFYTVKKFHAFCKDLNNKPYEILHAEIHQHKYIFDSNDNLQIDFFGKLENIEEDFKKLNSLLIENNRTPYEYKKSNIKSNSMDLRLGKHYELFYNENIKEIVYNYFIKDFKLLNYDK